MENLESESLINKDEKKEENVNILKNDTNENEINTEEVEKEGEFSTNFEENIDLTEEEKNLRKNYLKKISKKRSFISFNTFGKYKHIIKTIFIFE